jgi:glycerol-3-phosphate acyltransferase PlsX
MQQKLTIAIDAMGGDNAPEAPVEGAVRAAKNTNTKILLVGDKDKVKSELNKHNVSDLSIEIVSSEGKIEDGESPALALRQKSKSSILVSTGLVKKGLADSVISMGSTGASMAAAVVVLGTIEGIDRPAVGGPIIGSAPNQIIMDLGSNIDCKSTQLLGFGVLGSVFSELLLKVTNPKIGLLSVGSEEGKGNALTKETYSLFQKSDLNFIGNIEGNDLVTGKADVVVCDGFVGNIVLKLVEGLGKSLSHQLQNALTDKMSSKDIDSLVKNLSQKNNVTDEMGGGPICGVNGVSIVGHGNATSKTIERAVDFARMCIETKLIEKMGQRTTKAMSTINQ